MNRSVTPKLMKEPAGDHSYVVLHHLKKSWKRTRDDPILRMPGILVNICGDLLLLKNQVPFFLIDTLFITSRISPTGGLKKMAFEFFNYSTLLRERSREICNTEVKHLLDLIRQTFIPCCCGEKAERKIWDSGSNSFLQYITSATRLHNKGLVLKPKKNAHTWLDVQLKEGVLKVPPLVYDNFIGQVFSNSVAFEQSYDYCSKNITSYLVFMGCLMEEEADARFLNEKGILRNFSGPDLAVSRFFKSIAKVFEL